MKISLVADFADNVMGGGKNEFNKQATTRSRCQSKQNITLI